LGGDWGRGFWASFWAEVTQISLEGDRNNAFKFEVEVGDRPAPALPKGQDLLYGYGLVTTLVEGFCDRRSDPNRRVLGEPLLRQQLR
jgi:hypothetical protein